MNKYQEALRIMCNGCEEASTGGCDGFNPKCHSYEPLKELVEKATPKKVENKKDHYVFDTTEYSHTGGECPNCKELVYCDGYNQDAYCSNCGQRILWESEDE